jgi:hypothetical protein
MNEFEAELFSNASLEFESKELTRLYQDIRDYEALINNTETSEQERSEVVDSLDGRWPYMNKMIEVSGNFVIAVQNDPLDPDELTYISEYFDDKAAESIGFSIMKVVNEEGNFRWVIGHRVIFEPETTFQQPMLRNFSVRHGFAPLDEAIISYPFESKEANFDKLHYRFPDAAADIDSAILNSSNECSAVESLADVSISLGIHESPEDVRAIAEYVNSLLDFDTKVPYQMEFQGPCYVVDDEGPNGLRAATAAHGTTLAYPIQIDTIVEQRCVDVASKKFEAVLNFGIRIEIVNEDPGRDTGKHYVIPITETFSMQDVRSLVYIGLHNYSDKS